MKYYESYSIDPIETGYLVSVRDENYNHDKHAFADWEGVQKFLDNNRPGIIDRESALGNPSQVEVAI